MNKKSIKAIREIKKVKDHKVTVCLPIDYEDKEVEVIIISIDKNRNKVGVKSFFNQFNLNLSDFKFNREEANAR